MIMRPNWFLAFQFDDSAILQKMRQIQNHVTSLEPKLSGACVPVEKAHMTLFAFHSDNAQQVSQIVDKVVQTFKFEQENHLLISARKIGHFDHRVIFAELDITSEIQQLWAEIGRELAKNAVIDDAASLLNDVKPHLTLLKLSKMKKKSKLRKIQPDLYQEFISEDFGQQKIKSVQLLSMTEPVSKDTGYYFCHQQFPINTMNFSSSSEN